MLPLVAAHHSFLEGSVRRRIGLCAAIMLLVAALDGATAIAARRPTLQVRRTHLGSILVDSQGYTLYTFTKDTRNRDDCASLAACLDVWPALVSRQPTLGPGVKRRLIGTIAVAHVGRQVTYAGHPLYSYVGDGRPAETDNINIFQSQGYWPAIAPSGGAVK
jgi:predicted lipoprotein with Yx(FWY)xxD motif